MIASSVLSPEFDALGKSLRKIRHDLTYVRTMQDTDRTSLNQFAPKPKVKKFGKT